MKMIIIPKTDCNRMEYNINDKKSFEDIKFLWENKLKKFNETNIINLIGIKKGSNEEKAKLEAIKFSEINIIKFFVISGKNEKDTKVFNNDLLEQF